MAEAAEGNASSGTTHSKLNYLVLGLVLFNTLAIASVAFFIYAGKKKEAQKPGVDELVVGELEARKLASETEKSFEKTLFQFKDFVVNLSGSRGRRILKATIEVELPHSEAKKEIEAKEAQIRDQIILILSSKTYEEVATIQGKDQLRQEIKSTINPLLSEGNKIINVFFTDFIYN